MREASDEVYICYIEHVFLQGVVGINKESKELIDLLRLFVPNRERGG